MRVIVYIFLIFLSFSLNAEDVVKYRVVQGDTLSGILLKLNIGPIYGPKGFQKLSAKVNKLKLSGNKIKEGDLLIFPAAAVNRVISGQTDTALAETIPVETSQDDFNQYHSLIVSPQISWLNYTSESSDAFQHNDLKIQTKPVPGVHLQYELNWDENLKFLIFTYLSKVSFYPDDQLNYKRNSVSRNNYGMGISYKNGASEWGSKLGFYDQLFFSLPSTTEIETNVVALPELHLSYRNIIRQYKKMSFKIGLNGKAILPYQTQLIKGEAGYGAGLEFLVGSARKNLRFFLNHSQANASDTQTIASEIGLGFVIEGNFYDE